jgi:hypothetical protein
MIKSAKLSAAPALDNKTDAPALIHLRPHHLMCIQNYRGHGYSEAFQQRMETILDVLRQRPGSGLPPIPQIRIAEGADDLCAACPHCLEEKCESDKPAVFDGLVSERMGLETGCMLNMEDLQNTEMTLQLLEECCPGCSWLGLCREIIMDEQKK